MATKSNPTMPISPHLQAMLDAIRQFLIEHEQQHQPEQSTKEAAKPTFK